MKAGRIHQFGGPEVIAIDEVPRPTPDGDEVIVRVPAAGVGPWDVLIRERKSVVNLELPIILGSDLAGIVDSVGRGVTDFAPGDEVYGVTNKDFCGAYAEYAAAKVRMIAPKPKSQSRSLR
jgi:NADPH:quinone reductase-like Zn-dependent oxidoreductase